MSHAVILQSWCSLWPNVSNIKLYNIYRPDCLKERQIQETRKACGKYVLSCGNIFPTNALSPFVIQIRKHSNIELIYFYANISYRLFCILCIGMFIMLFSMIIWNSIFKIVINMLIKSCALHVSRQKIKLMSANDDVIPHMKRKSSLRRPQTTTITMFYVRI